MSAELLTLIPALILFCFAAAFTPGPNNILLTYSGANFGVKRSLNHVIGIRVGMTAIHVIMLFGLGSLFLALPVLHAALQVVASLYIVYLAIKIARTSTIKKQDSLLVEPMSIKQAALFQIVNPKSLTMIISVCSALTLPGDLYWHSAIMGLIIFNIVGVCCALFWVTTGKYISKYLQSPQSLKRFNLIMAVLLLGCLPLIFIA